MPCMRRVRQSGQPTMPMLDATVAFTSTSRRSNSRQGMHRRSTRVPARRPSRKSRRRSPTHPCIGRALYLLSAWSRRLGHRHRLPWMTGAQAPRWGFAWAVLPATAARPPSPVQSACPERLRRRCNMQRQTPSPAESSKHPAQLMSARPTSTTAPISTTQHHECAVRRTMTKDAGLLLPPPPNWKIGSGPTSAAPVSRRRKRKSGAIPKTMLLFSRA